MKKRRERKKMRVPRFLKSVRVSTRGMLLICESQHSVKGYTNNLWCLARGEGREGGREKEREGKRQVCKCNARPFQPHLIEATSPH